MSYGHALHGGHEVKLSHVDPSDHGGLERDDAEKHTASLGLKLQELTELLYAAGMNGLLIVLQGRDTSGKDGLIRHLLTYINAQSCEVAPFKAPTPIEVSHDFLWRVHPHVPGRGGITIFNRSHYEDVLVVRVHNLVPEKVWRARYDHINAFERNVTDAGVILLKFYLHIDKAEQEQRLLDREKDTTKAWKLAVGDWQERELWDKYTSAYEEALTRCSTPYAPWNIVSANHKWFRNLIVTEAIVEALEPHRDGWMKHLAGVGEAAKKELAEYRAGKKAGR